MFVIKIHRDLCKSCGLCIRFCPRKLLVTDPGLNKRGVTPVKFENNPGTKCTGCGNCATICPDAAIEIEEIDDASAAPDEPQKPTKG